MLTELKSKYGNQSKSEAWTRWLDENWYEAIYNSLKFSLETTLNNRQKDLMLLNLNELRNVLIEMLEDEGYYEPTETLKKLKVLHDLLVDSAVKYDHFKDYKELALECVKLTHEIIKNIELAEEAKRPDDYMRKYEDNKLQRELSMLTNLAHKIQSNRRNKQTVQLSAKAMAKIISDVMVKHYHHRNKLINYLAKLKKEGKL